MRQTNKYIDIQVKHREWRKRSTIAVNSVYLGSMQCNTTYNKAHNHSHMIPNVPNRVKWFAGNIWSVQSTLHMLHLCFSWLTIQAQMQFCNMAHSHSIHSEHTTTSYTYLWIMNNIKTIQMECVDNTSLPFAAMNKVNYAYSSGTCLNKVNHLWKDDSTVPYFSHHHSEHLLSSSNQVISEAQTLPAKASQHENQQYLYICGNSVW